MRTLIAVLLAGGLVTNSFAGGIQERDFRWNDDSGRMHYGAMSVGTFALTGWLYAFPISRGKAITISACTGLGLGLLKESLDAGKGGTGFSMNDIYHDVLGVGTGISPFVLTVRF